MEKDVSARFDKLDATLDRILNVVIDTQQHVTKLEERMTALEDRVDRLTTAVDKLAKSIDTLVLEYASIKVQLSRHEAWFKQIAEKVGIELKV